MSAAYSIDALTAIYSKSLSSSFDAKRIVLEGFYIDKNGKLYSSVYYDELLDKNKKSKITLQLTEELKSKLISGNYYQLEGFLNKGNTIKNDFRLPIFFRATKILKYEEEIQLISQAEYNIVKARFDRDFPIIEDIFLNIMDKGLRPKIDIILGLNSTSLNDYKNQLYNEEYYHITHHKFNLSSQTEITDFLDCYDFGDTDAIIILRGGGSGLEVFNEMELCKKMINLDVPFITGIGHDEDKTLLQKVADKAFSTPTSVGVFLQKIVETQKKRRFKLAEKDAEILQIQKNNEEEKELLNQQLSSYKKNVLRLLSIIVFLTVILIFVIYKLN